MTILWSFSYNSFAKYGHFSRIPLQNMVIFYNFFAKFHGKKYLEQQHDHVISKSVL